MNETANNHDNNLESIGTTDIIARVSNLFYEMMFVVDVTSGKIISIPPTSGLANNLMSKSLSINNLENLINILRYGKDPQLTKIFNAINGFYSLTPDDHKKSLLFIMEMRMAYHDVSHKSTYKFTPLSETPDGKLKYMVGAISLSSGTRRETLHALDTSDGQRHYYDFSTGKWHRFSTPILTQIENDVLSLSAEGLSVPEISKVIYRAQDSVKSIRKRIFEKLGAANITEAIIFATNYKII